MNVKNENVWYFAFECQVYDVFLRKVADRKIVDEEFFLVNLVQISGDEVTMKRCCKKIWPFANGLYPRKKSLAYRQSRFG